MSNTVWGIHTTDDDLFLRGGVIAVGFEIGDASKLARTREAFKEKYKELHPSASTNSVGVSAGMIYRFVCEIEIGDYVVYPSKVDRKIHIGKIIGEYEFVEDADFGHQRKVEWFAEYPRIKFSQGALYEIGSAITFFSVKNYADEFINPDTAGDDKNAGFVSADEINETTNDF
ncbi:MAG: restriction endonuclease, partial [Abditibacteriota bacterium]|nr:restriction endonuclease [Abditibacteriota bacterium]